MVKFLPFCCFSPFTAARYHSLVVERDDFPDELEITAWTEDGLVMAANHKKYRHLQVKYHAFSLFRHPLLLPFLKHDRSWHSPF